MSLYPHAKHRLVNYAASLPHRDPAKTVILHTNGGGTDHGSLFGWFNRAGNDICAHFQIMWDGTCEQYVDTDHEAYAQYSGNAYGVSIETQDDGNPSKPWTDKQIAAIIAVCKWVGCPPRISPDGAGGGVGWHELYADWNKSHHSCPGAVRERQIREKIIPGLGHPLPRWYTRPLRVENPELTGRDVSIVRAKLGMAAAGAYTTHTAVKVREYQRSHKLYVSGSVGEETATALGE